MYLYTYIYLYTTYIYIYTYIIYIIYMRQGLILTRLQHWLRPLRWLRPTAGGSIAGVVLLWPWAAAVAQRPRDGGDHPGKRPLVGAWAGGKKTHHF